MCSILRRNMEPEARHLRMMREHANEDSDLDIVAKNYTTVTTPVHRTSHSVHKPIVVDTRGDGKTEICVRGGSCSELMMGFWPVRKASGLGT